MWPRDCLEQTLFSDLSAGNACEGCSNPNRRNHFFAGAAVRATAIRNKDVCWLDARAQLGDHLNRVDLRSTPATVVWRDKEIGSQVDLELA